MESKLSPEELKRYSRHLVLKEFGMEGQLKLKQSHILVVGAGGLGCPALLYLAAAGVGHLGIVDFDIVQESNLQRQVLFTIEDIGEKKPEAAAKRLHALNPLISITPHSFQLTSHNALEVINDYDIIIDGSDNFPTRYLLNDACVLLNKCFVYGSVLSYEGQVSVFNVLQNNTYSSNYRDLFPSPPLPNTVPDCQQAGVLGVLPGIIGTMQANEAIKLITGIGEPLANKLLIVDSSSMDITLIKIQSQDSRNEIKTLIDYEGFCGFNKKNSKPLGMKEVTVQELQDIKKSGVEFQLIDVREQHEYDTCNLEGELIPLSQIPHHIEMISKVKKVIFHCHHGNRSGTAIQWLEKNHNMENLYNLKGGIAKWASEIDPAMPTY